MTNEQKEALLILLESMVIAHCRTSNCRECGRGEDECPSTLLNKLKKSFEDEE